METVIIGHKNPDTDSVVSAIAYSNLKNKIDPKNKYIPAIAGKLDKDTKFVLNYFNQATPKIINKLSNWKGQIIILDHTELSQTPLGMDESKIKEIIDHHRLGGMQAKSMQESNQLVRHQPLLLRCLGNQGLFQVKELLGC